ncbi:MAG: hypothetical protein U0133_11745 [Gemmatimonadales bacterium]
MIRVDRTAAADSLLIALDTLTFVAPALRWDALIRRGAFDTLETALQNTIARGIADERRDAWWWRAIALRVRGQLRAALAPARKAGPGSLEAQVLCEGGAVRQGAEQFQRIADRALVEAGDQAPQYHRDKHRAWYLTQVASCLALAGDTAGLVPLADTIRVIGARTSWVRDQRLHHYVRGLIWKARKDWVRAAAEFRAATSSPVNGLTRNNYELAGALLSLGDARGAIASLQAALLGPQEAGGLYLTRTELEERLAEAFTAARQLDSARVHYRQVVNAWRNADPQFRSRWNVALTRSR